MTDSKEQLHGTITARAELDRAFARLIIEDVTSVMSKNISTVLKMMENQHLEAMEVLGGASEAIKKLVEDVGTLQAQMGDSQEDRQTIHDELAEVKADVSGLSDRFDKYIAGNRRGELDAIQARLAALEARGDGDG